MVRMLMILSALILSLCGSAGAWQATHSCVLSNGRQVRAECSPLVRATPTPAPTRSSSPTVADNTCPDGYLTTLASKTDPWFGVTTDIPEGTTKRFCARVTGQPWQIVFSWYDVSDQDCAAVNVRVDAPGDPPRPRGGDGFSASGSYVYYGRIGSKLTPEQVQPGDYVITLTGGPSTCSRFRVAWRVW